MKSSTIVVALLVLAGILLVGYGAAGFILARSGPDAVREEAANLTESTQQPQTANCSTPDFWDGTPDGISQDALPIGDLTIETSSGTVEMRVEVADEDVEQNQGLMFRESLGESCGMLFVYSSEETKRFTMRNTLIPLSIAFIDSEGEIIDLQDMEALDDEPPSYVSAEPAQYALEANVGFFEENGVKVGDRVDIPEE